MVPLFGCTISGIGVIESSWLCHDHKVIYQRPVAGIDHNSYRAEFFAILMTLSKVSRPVIYSDCLNAVEMLTHLISCHLNHLKPVFGDHQDIWLQIWHQVRSRPPDFIRVVKIRAHQNPESIEDPFLKWQAVMNNRVDLVAKAAVCDWSPVFSKAEAVYQKITKQADNFAQHCQLIISQAEYNPQKESIANLDEDKPDFSSRAPCPGICDFYNIVVPEITSPFGDVFLQRVVN